MAWSEQEMKIAEWMFEEYQKHQFLSQSTAARDIRLIFGEAYVYKNRLCNWGINKNILEAFKALTLESVVWSRSFQTWRARTMGDPITTRIAR